MSSLFIFNARLLDPSSNLDQKGDLLLLNGKIEKVGQIDQQSLPKEIQRFDARGAIVCPGLVDSHVHLREPGQSAKETIATGTQAAARGGFTSVLCMPNTSPAIDNAGTVALIREKAAREGVVHVFVTGAITKGIAGEELAPIGSLKQAGVVAITDDGHCVQSNELMRRALEYCKMFDLPILDHCQDYSLVTDGVMHEGYWSAVLGLGAWPASGEEAIVARNILLAELTGSHVHCQHLSSAGSVRLLREAKSRGVPISGEACPHHYTLTDSTIAGSEAFWNSDGQALKAHFGDHPLPSWPQYDTNFKMNPPLRSAADRQAIIDGVLDGTLEILGSDHAPHCNYQKEVEFDHAPFGITGLENQFSLALMQLHHLHGMPIRDIVRCYTINPARLLRIPKGTLNVGADADVTIFNPDEKWIFKREDTVSKSRNNPFYDWPMRGKIKATIVSGKLVWQDA